MNKPSSEQIKRKEIIQKNQKHEKDVGSSQVQVALLTSKIDELVEHLKIHKKDHSSRRGLIKKVNLRKKLLKYLKSRSFLEYKKLALSLNLRT